MQLVDGGSAEEEEEEGERWDADQVFIVQFPYGGACRKPSRREEGFLVNVVMILAVAMVCSGCTILMGHGVMTKTRFTLLTAEGTRGNKRDRKRGHSTLKYECVDVECGKGTENIDQPTPFVYLVQLMFQILKSMMMLLPLLPKRRILYAAFRTNQISLPGRSVKRHPDDVEILQR